LFDVGKTGSGSTLPMPLASRRRFEGRRVELSSGFSRRRSRFRSIVSVDPKNAGRAPVTSSLPPGAPEHTISGATPSPAVLARILVARFVDHLSFDRQEQTMGRDGLPVGRGTLAAWAGECHDAARVVVDAMIARATESARVIAVDAAGVLVQNQSGGKRGHFWIGVADHDDIFFRHSPRPAKDQEVFTGFDGALLADASAVYEVLAGEEKPSEVTWTQVRRRFLEAARGQREAAFAAVALIEKLFAVERELKDLAPARRVETRKARCVPILEQLTEWKEKRFASPSFEARSPLARALVELDRHWTPLTRFLADGRARMDDMPGELELRRAITGRKGWLFVAADDDPPVACTFVSLIASARVHGIDPEAYLGDLLRVLPRWPRDRAIELAPARWTRTREKLELR
jgi:transposase